MFKNTTTTKTEKENELIVEKSEIDYTYHIVKNCRSSHWNIREQA